MWYSMRERSRFEREGTMELSEAMQVYFRGEKHVAFFLVALGVALALLAAWVWRTQSGPFALWLLTPLALVGVGAAIGGVVFAMKTEAQVRELTQRLEADRGELVRSESARMEKVNANWPRLKLAWGVITLVALGLLLAVHREWATGLGLALMLLMAVLFFVDVFAERRAAPYTEAIERARADGG